jgi:hypothetical protein
MIESVIFNSPDKNQVTIKTDSVTHIIDYPIPEDEIYAGISASLKNWIDEGNDIEEYNDPPEHPAVTRDRALSQLTYDLGDGRIIQTRPSDEQNIRNAIEIMVNNPKIKIKWRMLDNTAHEVTAEELKAALSNGQLSALAIWGKYNAES